jgi:TonB-linked SusC/RagA family outer membrane protein
LKRYLLFFKIIKQNYFSMKKLSLLLFMFLFVLGTSWAQRTVSGTITDDTGAPLIGANVLVKNTNVGTISDLDGKYELSVPQGGTALVFSYTGFASQEMALTDAAVYDVILSEGVTLADVVVTALGVQREKKSLGYATQEVTGDEVTRVKDVNFINSLSGKIAGVDIKRSTQMGGSTNVIIRGAKSLNYSSQAMFVVDGTPISNEIYNTTDQQTGRGGFDYGNTAMDVNPEDIESITVLRGAAATALYGSRAANGVILITTKKGGKNKELGVSVSSGITMSQIDPSTFIRYQKEYGAGYSTYLGWYPEDRGFEYFDFGDGQGLSANVYEDASFGPAFDLEDNVYNWQSYYPELDTYGKAVPYEAAENDASKFYERGITYNNNISFDGGTEKSHYRLSYTNFNMKGNLPNSSIKKNTVNFSGGFDFTDKLSAGSTISYINTNAVGRYGTGYDNRNPNQSFRQWYQVSTDMVEQWEAYDLTGKNITWNPYGSLDPSNPTKPHYFDNYYFNRYENYQNDERNRMIGNVSLNYQATDWLGFLLRTSLDRYSFTNEERIAVGSIDVPSYLRSDRLFSEYNHDFIISFNKYFGADDVLNIDGNLGINLNRIANSQIEAETNGGLVVPNIYALSNSASPIESPEEAASKVATNGYFGRLSLGYANFLYLDLTGRYDVTSTLPEENNAYFYPSASLSLLFSELLNADALSFGKLRFNYAEVGNGGRPLAIRNTYLLGTPFAGVALASASNTLANPNMLPELTRSLEAGIEMRFFKDRFGLDLSVYQSNSFNQILPVRVSGSTGSLFKYVNAGDIKNQGIEIAVNTSPVRSKKFNWDLNLTWYANQNEVVELYEDQTNLQLTNVQGGVTINATVGEPFGALWGTNYVYHEGEPIVYPHWESGMRFRKTSTPEVIGNINPDWKGGVTNIFNYGNLTFSFLVDVQMGGDFFSLDTWYGYATGVYDFTAGENDKGNPVRAFPADGGGLPIGGVLHATDSEGNYLYDDDGLPISDGTVNEEYGYAADVYSSFGYVYAPNAYHVYDASYVKLRELTLGYTLPSSLFDSNVISGIDISLVGRNLWIIHKNSPYSDPEAGLSAGRYLGNQSGAYPSLRELGLNLKVRF